MLPAPAPANIGKYTGQPIISIILVIYCKIVVIYTILYYHVIIIY